MFTRYLVPSMTDSSKPLPTLNTRSAGVLLHATSLGGHYGTGDLGKPAFLFVDWLERAGFRWWQMLPITPASADNSPYESISAFAGWEALISLEQLIEPGLLKRRELAEFDKLPEHTANFTAAQKIRRKLLRTAYQRFEPAEDFHAFCAEHQHWLEDWALHEAIRSTQHNKPWHQWPQALRLRHKHALTDARKELAPETGFHVFVQYLFECQWSLLRAVCRDAGIALIGDVPIFVGMDAADVWANRRLFDLDRHGEPNAISGVPPDMFSATGQIWDHPLYNWKNHAKTNHAWWAQRMRRALQQFDAVRIDHFLGFCRNWAIPASTRDARDGSYRKGPGAAFFASLIEQLGPMNVIAEDLGVVTDHAIELRDAMGFPGMSVTQFGFGEDNAQHAPHNHLKHSVAYSGTHDNDTLVGFFRNAESHVQKRILTYAAGSPATVAQDLTRLTLTSPANIAIIPPQDLLSLGSEHRMNIPGKKRGNWTWRLHPKALTTTLAKQINPLLKATGRLA